MTTGDRIRELRINAGWTQQQLADKIGVKKAAVSKWENGTVPNIKRNVIANLAKVFNVSPLDILAFDDDRLNDNEKLLIKYFRMLNPEGKSEALSRLSEMAELKRFTEDTTFKAG